MRACHPAVDETLCRDGVEIRYERYGQGSPTILLLPAWSFVHSRHWKMQIPFLSRHYTVVCFDGRGNGGSSRPAGPQAYTVDEFTEDAAAVMDATDTGTAVLVSLSAGACWALQLCAQYPQRVLGSVFISPALPLAPPLPERAVQRFDEVFEDPIDWEKYNAPYWHTNYPDFVEFFANRLFTEPHSTKPVEDAISWALETDGETLAAIIRALTGFDAGAVRDLADQVACPVLVIHSADDAVRSYAAGKALAEGTRGALATLQGAGHCPHLRDPARVNLLIKQFIDRIAR